MNCHFLTVRGAPGVGKSSFARRLLHALRRGVLVEVDEVRGMEHGANWRDPVRHRRALRAAGDLALSFAAQGRRPIVVVDTFGGGKLWGFLRHLRRKADGLRIQPIALHCRESVLRDRLGSRPGWQFQDWTASRILNERLPRTGVAGEVLLDVSELSPDQAVDKALRLLRAGS